MCQSVIFGSLTLREAKKKTLDFGVKFNFSKFRMEPVMHDFLARTENQKKRDQNNFRTIESKTRESRKKKQQEIAIRNFHHYNNRE